RTRMITFHKNGHAHARTPQHPASAAAVVLGAAAFPAVLVGVLVHTGWIGPGAALWVAVVVLIAVWGVLRFPVNGARRPASTQVRAQLRVRNG
ncbi:hypothetical protein ABT085_38545, partial [Streptomyces sp. NPDC002265]